MKVALVCQNGHVRVFERIVDAHWGKVTYIEVPGIITIPTDPQPPHSSLRRLLTAALTLATALALFLANT